MNQKEIEKLIKNVLRNATEIYLKENNPLHKGQVYSEIIKIERIADPAISTKVDTVELVTKGEIKVNGSIEVQVMESMGNGNSKRARLGLSFRDVVLNYSEERISISEGSFDVWSVEKI